MAVIGLCLVVAIIAVNIVNNVSSDNHHHFDHSTNLALGAVALIGAVLLVIGVITSIVDVMRRLLR